MYLITHWSEGSQRMILRKTIYKEDNYENIWGYDDLDISMEMTTLIAQDNQQ